MADTPAFEGIVRNDGSAAPASLRTPLAYYGGKQRLALGVAYINGSFTFSGADRG